jgi:diacylglycerol diphosphate phosphatase / phosphatidate phosphatase
MEPFHRMFSLRNLSIQYPHALVERVSSGWNIIYAGIVPLVILILWLVALRAGVHQFHVTLLGFFIAYIYLAL